GGGAGAHRTRSIVAGRFAAIWAAICFLPATTGGGVDRDSIERVRSATFPVARRGYDKREVDRFLTSLAEWLETGGADQSRNDVIRRELERVGEETGRILTEAHDVGERLRVQAE